MHNVFAGAFVDRSGDKRKDPEWLDEAMSAPDSVFLPVLGDRCLVNAEQNACQLLGRNDVSDALDVDELVFLGLFHDRPAFAFPVGDEHASVFDTIGEFQDLRFIGTALPADEANLAAHARAMILWNRSQVYCGHCGERAMQQHGGNTRLCSGCGRTLFPRVDPAIIVLVSRGERCLLGRQPGWPDGRYSTIAGFVEPGESLEDAVRREVFEETNIRVGDVRYSSSQPWPFPSSLMLGFQAEGLTDDILLNDGELDDARWFTRKELHADFPILPYRISIARRLVDQWLNRED